MIPTPTTPATTDAEHVSQSLGLRVWMVPITFLAIGTTLSVATALSPLWGTGLVAIGLALALLCGIVEFESLPPVARQPVSRSTRSTRSPQFAEAPIATERFLRRETERYDQERRISVLG